MDKELDKSFEKIKEYREGLQTFGKNEKTKAAQSQAAY